MIPITDAIWLDERDVDERFVRASGPGGQNVNKVSTAVELRFNVASSSLPGRGQAAVDEAGRQQDDQRGHAAIDSRENRLQSQNRVAATRPAGRADSAGTGAPAHAAADEAKPARARNGSPARSCAAASRRPGAAKAGRAGFDVTIEDSASAQNTGVRK